MGGHDFAYFTFVRDWSPWVVSDETYEELRPLMRLPRTGDRILNYGNLEQQRLSVDQVIKKLWKLSRFGNLKGVDAEGSSTMDCP